MTRSTRQVGNDAESLAAHFLTRQGYRILTRNYRNRVGEIDLIAQHRDCLVFIEVKARRTGRYGSPKMAITPTKMRKLTAVAQWYLKETQQSGVRARFDVVAVHGITSDADIELVQNAFPVSY
jgi:putative endonuclease